MKSIWVASLFLTFLGAPLQAQQTIAKGSWELGIDDTLSLSPQHYDLGNFETKADCLARLKQEIGFAQTAKLKADTAEKANPTDLNLMTRGVNADAYAMAASSGQCIQQ
jgi:hypothetical protein